tara:strand:+ start:1843 stop:2253 length:411 start_codon:yes stop_codon:yes gene_type:complete
MDKKELIKDATEIAAIVHDMRVEFIELNARLDLLQMKIDAFSNPKPSKNQIAQEIKYNAQFGKLIEGAIAYDYTKGKFYAGWGNEARQLKVGDSAIFACPKDAANFYQATRRCGYRVLRVAKTVDGQTKITLTRYE